MSEHICSVSGAVRKAALGKLFRSFIPSIFVIALLFLLLHCVLPLLTFTLLVVFQEKFLGFPMQVNEYGSRNSEDGAGTVRMEQEQGGWNRNSEDGARAGRTEQEW